ncbi:DUF2254 domain-containing protein [Pontibacter sp. 13R65]|uniref:DUF2254 domain-containing protein n=1 Tax=Pontibacter sp. 13R65 TaxID=3127458 RepID=UPI00301D9457
MKIAKAKYSLKKALKQVTTSIAFYPILITFSLLVFSWITTYLDKIFVGSFLVDKVPYLRIDNADTASSLLSSLLTGLISLVTFTFTMVMVVLTQVTSSFSPRLLPDLISEKGSQIVLGIIMGTIFYIIVVLSNIGTMISGPEVPVLSVFISMFLGFTSLLSFIYFIHKISNQVQIGNILNDIYLTTRNALSREIESDCYFKEWEEPGNFRLVKAWDSGYFDSITEKEFLREAKKLGLTIRLRKVQGLYLLKGEPFLEINQPLNDKIRRILEENILLRHQEMVMENFLYGFKHLTEVAVKALSPSVNDPGTAIQAINYLLDLLCRLQQLDGQKVVKKDDGATGIMYAPIQFDKVFYLCTSSIRAYSSQDVTVQATLIYLISKVSERDEEKKYQQLYMQELDAIEETSTKNVDSQADIDHIKRILDKVRKKYHLSSYL